MLFLFQTNAFGMNAPASEDIFVFEDGENTSAYNDIKKLGVTVIGDDKNAVIRFQYKLGPGMVHTPLQNSQFSTQSQQDNQGLVTFYYVNNSCPDPVKTAAAFANAPYGASAFLFLRAADWDIEYQWYEMIRSPNNINNQKYMRLLAFLISDMQSQKSAGKKHQSTTEHKEHDQEDDPMILEE